MNIEPRINLDGLIKMGEELSYPQTSDRKFLKLQINNGEEKFVITEKREEKTPLIIIAKKINEGIQNRSINGLSKKEIEYLLIEIKELKHRLLNTQKNNPIRTFFLNLFTWWQYEKRVSLFDAIISNIEKKQIEMEDIKKEKITIIESINKESKLDLHLDDHYIDQKFGLSKFLLKLPKDEALEIQTKIHTIVNTAYIERQLKQKGSLSTHSEDEGQLLSIILEISENSEELEDQENEIKHFVYERIKEKLNISNISKDILQGPLTGVKKMIEEIALESRLEGLDDKEIKKFKILLLSFREMKDQLKMLADKSLFLPSNLSPDSPYFHYLKKLQENFKDYVVKYQLTSFFKEIEELDVFENIDFEEILKRETQKIKLSLENQSSKFNEILNSFEDGGFSSFIKKWEKNLTFPFMQEFQDLNNSSGALGGGICWGMSVKFLAYFIDHPESDLKELSIKNEISSDHRFLQALLSSDLLLSYKKNEKEIISKILRLEVKSDTVIVDYYRQMIIKEQLNEYTKYYKDISYDLLRLEELENKTDQDLEFIKAYKEQLTELEIFKNKSRLNILNSLTEKELANIIESVPEEKDVITTFIEEINSGIQNDKWVESKGAMMLNLSELGAGHAIVIRIDKTAGIAWIFDPNMGYLSFEENDFEINKEKFFNCLTDLYNTFYSNIDCITITTLSKITEK